MTNELIEKLESISAELAILHDNIAEGAPSEILETQSFTVYKNLCEVLSEAKGE